MACVMTPEETALVAQVHREDRDCWEREVERELDPKQRGVRVEVHGGRKYKIGTQGTTFWWGRSQYDLSKYIVGVHPDSEPESKMYIDARWLRVIDGCEPSLSEYTSTDEEALSAARETLVAQAEAVSEQVKHEPNVHGYGPHAGSCPACLVDEANGTPFTASPRSETYWSS